MTVQHKPCVPLACSLGGDLGWTVREGLREDSVFTAVPV